jgi:hypothetical protein
MLLPVGHGGAVSEYNSPQVDTIIAKALEAAGRREAKQVNPRVVFLRPTWIFASCDRGQLCPTDKFEIW